MARGSVYSGITANVASSAYMWIQPASGVEVKIKHAFGGASYGPALVIGTSSIYGFVGDGAAQISSSDTYQTTNFNVFINNSIYLGLQNTGSGASNIAYSGITTV